MSQIERRIAATVLEVRDDDADGITLTGYASTFDEPYDMGWYTESVERTAFNRTLGRKPDVRLLINHDGLPLARTTSGTLTLDTDSHGLRVSANLDPSDPDVQRLAPKMKRGDASQMSFAFRIDSETWSDDFSRRSLRELDLNNGDVSVVTYPANPGTTAGLRADGPTLEPVISVLAALEARKAPVADVLDVLERAMKQFRGIDVAELVEKVAEATEDDPQTNLDPQRDLQGEVEARMRRLRLLG